VHRGNWNCQGLPVVIFWEREEREEIDQATRNDALRLYIRGRVFSFFYKHKHTLQFIKKSGDIENSLSICSE
jgi:hypothetical protein